MINSPSGDHTSRALTPLTFQTHPTVSTIDSHPESSQSLSTAVWPAETQQATAQGLKIKPPPRVCSAAAINLTHCSAAELIAQPPPSIQTHLPHLYVIRLQSSLHRACHFSEIPQSAPVDRIRKNQIGGRIELVLTSDNLFKLSLLAA